MLGETKSEIEGTLPRDPMDKNMKSHLDTLFKEYIDTGYNEEKHGAILAKKMDNSEIPSDIKELIGNVVSMNRRR